MASVRGASATRPNQAQPSTGVRRIAGRRSGVNLHYIPVHLQPYYRDLGFLEGDFPQAERYYAEAISLPLFPLLSDEQQGYVVEQLRRLVLKA